MNTDTNSGTQARRTSRERVVHGPMPGADPRRRRGQLIFGVTLVALGVAYLVNRDDPEALSKLWHYWSFVLVAFGVANMLPPTNGKQFVDGLSQALFGAWFYISFEGLWGMSFGNSWPLLIIVAGAGMVLQPLAARWFPAADEEQP